MKRVMQFCLIFIYIVPFFTISTLAKYAGLQDVQEGLHIDSSSSSLSLIHTRELDYDSMISSSSRYFSTSLNQELNTNDITNTTPLYYNVFTSFRLSAPYGQKVMIKAIKFYPTWLMLFEKNGTVFLPGNLLNYLLNTTSFDIEVYRSCRLFSVNHLTHPEKNTTQNDAMNDIKDEISSLAFPCKDVYTNENCGGDNISEMDNIIYRKSSIPWNLQIHRSLWWSYVYDVTLLLSQNFSPIDGFIIDTTNATKMLEESLKISCMLKNQQVLLLEPNAVWVSIKVRTPTRLNVEDVSNPGWTNSILEANKNVTNGTNNGTTLFNPDHMLICTVHVPVWDIDKDIVESYQNVNSTFDYFYKLQSEINPDKISLKYNNESYNPFFMSNFFSDIYSQLIAIKDQDNYYAKNWTAYQAKSRYNNRVYAASYFSNCYNTSNSDETNIKNGNFNLFYGVSQNLTNPSIAYRIYAMDMFDTERDELYPWTSLQDMILSSNTSTENNNTNVTVNQTSPIDVTSNTLVTSSTTTSSTTTTTISSTTDIAISTSMVNTTTSITTGTKPTENTSLAIHTNTSSYNESNLSDGAKVGIIIIILLSGLALILIPLFLVHKGYARRIRDTDCCDALIDTSEDDTPKDEYITQYSESANPEDFVDMQQSSTTINNDTKKDGQKGCLNFINLKKNYILGFLQRCSICPPDTFVLEKADGRLPYRAYERRDTSSDVDVPLKDIKRNKKKQQDYAESILMYEDSSEEVDDPDYDPDGMGGYNPSKVHEDTTTARRRRSSSHYREHIPINHPEIVYVGGGGVINPLST